MCGAAGIGAARSGYELLGVAGRVDARCGNATRGKDSTGEYDE